MPAMNFVHLHVHTQYSVLDGLSNMGKLFQRAEELGMGALAITDHGNMYGAKEFLNVARKHPSVKPIVGCEVYVSHGDHMLREKGYWHLILLAKNLTGYRNLSKIVSEAHLHGMYYKPRVDHAVIEKYHEGLICSSACIAGELPQALLRDDMAEAERVVEWHRRVFGDDYYMEVMLHPSVARDPADDVYKKQQRYCGRIFTLAQKLGVKVIATNDVHFVDQADGPVHDRLICLTTNSFVDDETRMRYTQQEYLKSADEMAALFPDHPEVLENTVAVAEKVECYSVDSDPILPVFDLPADFLADIGRHMETYGEIIEVGRNDKHGAYRGDAYCHSVAYLCHLTYAGARQRYGETLSAELTERIDFELKTLCGMGFPDYFLIVQDYIAEARRRGGMVGPGRGSAAGSVVAYCLRITNLDPIRFGLLFERFLNPDRVSMPDIDVDFEDLAAAHDYVEKKYGATHVARVITFGEMAARSAIKDVGRISRMPLEESIRLSKLVPEKGPLLEKKEVTYPFDPSKESLRTGFKCEEVLEKDGSKHFIQRGTEEVEVKLTLSNCLRLVPELRKEMEEGSELTKEVLRYASALEGTIRQVGMHACATIIGRGDLTEYLPMCLSRDPHTGQEVRTSQYDGHYIEEVGMLKMDFLGLATLSIIHSCLNLVKERHGVDIDIEAIPTDDAATFDLYGRGDTTGVFQFESPGMRNWLQRLRPERFDDLIAMNALYRPGPMDYIPDFVERKQGRQPITYDLPGMEECLGDTYGITVYQEQVMRLSQKLAGFSKGDADKLRKAMGKKQIAILDSLKGQFMEGGKANGHPSEILDKIWKDWEKFASYAFNKSHATGYAWISYQTAWLKAHYPAEFFASCLDNTKNLEEVSKFMDDCRAHGIRVLTPDVNESAGHFTVNDEGNVRFALGSIKGFGSNVVDALLKERAQGGPFKDVFDFVERVPVTLGKKTLESLVCAGAFDGFGQERARYLRVGSTGEPFVDVLARYADLYRNDTVDAGASLFGASEDMRPQRPEFPPMEGEVDPLEELQREKELVGMYLSSHPLDRYRLEMDAFTNCTLAALPERIAACEKKKCVEHVALAGIVVDVKRLSTKKGKPYTKASIEDFSGLYELSLFGMDSERFLPYLTPRASLFLEGDIAPRYKDAEQYDLRLTKMSLLGNLAETRFKSFRITLDTAQLDADFRKRLADTVKAHAGKVPLTLVLCDEGTGYRIPFRSRQFGVTVSQALMNDLRALGVPSYAPEPRQ